MELNLSKPLIINWAISSLIGSDEGLSETN